MNTKVDKCRDSEQAEPDFERKRKDTSQCFRSLFEIDTKDYNIKGESFSRPSARGIIIKNNKIAMIHSLKHDYFKFPGGGIEKGEKKEEALIREVCEEAGLIVIPKSIRKFGMVHRIQKGDYEDIFIQDNFYYLCEVEDRVQSQKLDNYEKEEKYMLQFVTPDIIIKANIQCKDEDVDQIMLNRENRVIEILIEEGYVTRE